MDTPDSRTWRVCGTAQRKHRGNRVIAVPGHCVRFNSFVLCELATRLYGGGRFVEPIDISCRDWNGLSLSLSLALSLSLSDSFYLYLFVVDN
jgi:hypothetical protein